MPQRILLPAAALLMASLTACRGSVLTHEGHAELDASIMDGDGRRAGAVALDRRGHLAAATSTGGMTNKRHGRIGDSPIILDTYGRGRENPGFRISV